MDLQQSIVWFFGLHEKHRLKNTWLQCILLITVSKIFKRWKNSFVCSNVHCTLTNTRIGHSEMHQRKQFFMQSSSFGHHFSCARNSTWIKINDFHFTLLCFSDRIKLRYRVTLKIIQWTLTPHSMNAFDWIRVLELILRLVPNKIYDFWLHEWFANQIKIWNESKQRTKQTN